jgi:hypothetical protein
MIPKQYILHRIKMQYILHWIENQYILHRIKMQYILHQIKMQYILHRIKMQYILHRINKPLTKEYILIWKRGQITYLIESILHKNKISIILQLSRLYILYLT